MKNKFLLFLLTILLTSTQCFAAWDASKPGDSEKLKDAPGLIRANFSAIATGTDSALLITNAKVASAAGIVDTKLATISTAGKVDATAITDLAGLPSGAGATPIANGGTGQTTAATARNALLPSQTSNSGKSLVTDATNATWGYPASLTLASQTAGDTSWFNGTLWARIAGGTTGMTYHANGTSAPSWAKVDVSDTAQITGVLAQVNGGTGATSLPPGVPSSTIAVWSSDNGAIPSGWTRYSDAAVTIPLGIDTYNKLMLHLDNDVTDSETTPKTVTNNNVTFSNTAGQFKFGYSGNFNGSTAYLTTPQVADFNFGSGDFTIDLWIRMKAVGSTQTIIQKISSSNNAYNEWNLTLNASNKLNFISYDGSATETGQFTSTSAFITDTTTLHHIAIERNGSSCLMFLDGTSVAVTQNTAFGTLTDGSGGTLVIGRDNPNNLYYLNAYVDELRVTKGLARWTASFTPQATAYSAGGNAFYIIKS